MTVHERPFGRYLEDFVVGDVYKHWPGKTITEADDHLFCMITMNHHPLHTNAWFAENESVQKRNVVVGNLVYSLVLGMSVPDVSGAAIANLEVETLQGALLGWGVPRLRDLPWRRTRDPWAVLVSELMLQQTQVPRVLPRYNAFLEQFPTPAACAAASVGDVVRAWEGLGYNRRAVNLHRAASAVAALGSFPATLDGLLALPGVGPYTARAVLAFAFEADAAVVDTNIARVLARVAGRRLTAREAQATADAWAAEGDAWAWNQALMDLGATVCTARTQACDACPLAPWCAWQQAGRPAPDPAVGSAGVSGGQSRFDGSDRQGRGRLVDALRRGPVAPDELAAVMGWPADPERAERVAATLVADGLARRDGAGTLHLP